MIELTVTLGNILTIISFAVIGLAAFFSIRSEVQLLNQRVLTLDERMTDFKDVLTQLAQGTARMDFMEQRIEEMRKGEGFKFDIYDSITARHRVEPNAPRTPR